MVLFGEVRCVGTADKPVVRDLLEFARILHSTQHLIDACGQRIILLEEESELLSTVDGRELTDDLAFGDLDCSFAGSIESACNLGLIKTFRQYKPSPSNAGFFEVEHLHPRYLGEQLKFN